MRIPDSPRRALARFGNLAVRPVPLLLTLAAVELATIAWLAFDTPHNGWVWHSGGDATEYWTAQWAVAHGFVPQAVSRWGLPVFYGWVPLVTGTTLLTGLPVIVPLQALVLVPLVLVLVWARRRPALRPCVRGGCGRDLGVRRRSSMMLAVADRYRGAFEQNFLAPHWAGLTNMADLPSVARCSRRCGRRCAPSTPDAIRPSGCSRARLAGVAIGLKPANAFFVARAHRPLRRGARPRRRARLRGRPRAGAARRSSIWKSSEGSGTFPSPRRTPRRATRRRDRSSR